EQVIAYKLEKLNDNLLFTQKQYTQKQKEFESLQDRLALFKDRNQNISSSRFQSQLQRLQSEYDIALSVLQELAKQLETTKLQVNRDTPIFTVIEPVIVPHEREQPKRKLIVLIWTFLGGVLSCGWVLVRHPAKEIFEKINQ
ncbi:MAG: GNVR domain-containing protein, partial [Flavobacteriaceae bacterium]